MWSAVSANKTDCGQSPKQSLDGPVPTSGPEHAGSGSSPGKRASQKQTGFFALLRLLGNEVCIYVPYLCSLTACCIGAHSVQGSRPEGLPRGSETLRALLLVIFPKLSPILTPTPSEAFRHPPA